MKKSLMILVVVVIFSVAAFWWQQQPSPEATAGLAPPVASTSTEKPARLPDNGQAPSADATLAKTGTQKTKPSQALQPRDLETDELVLALQNESHVALALVLEALQRVERCARYTRHPEGRARRLDAMAERGQSPDALLRVWKNKDAECPRLSPALNRTALRHLTRAADAGDFDAQVAYYGWGRRHIENDLTNTDLVQAYTDRMRRYVQPLLADRPSHSFELLARVYRDGWVYPRDSQLSATFRFAQAYLEQWSTSRIDEQRISMGRFLTDSQIDEAEQAGYSLFTQCCG